MQKVLAVHRQQAERPRTVEPSNVELMEDGLVLRYRTQECGVGRIAGA